MQWYADVLLAKLDWVSSLRHNKLLYAQRRIILFSQIKIGFLRGVGFSIALSISLAIIFTIISSMFDDIYSDIESGDYVEFDNTIELDAKLLSYEVSENSATILGVIENNTDYIWKETSVEAEFYLGEKFVKECTAEITTKIEPNGKEHFEFSCKSCESEFPKFDRVEIKINDSWQAD